MATAGGRQFDDDDDDSIVVETVACSEREAAGTVALGHPYQRWATIKKNVY